MTSPTSQAAMTMMASWAPSPSSSNSRYSFLVLQTGSLGVYSDKPEQRLPVLVFR